ncbi:hypothetical protein [Streptomyces sp. NPDC002640]
MVPERVRTPVNVLLCLAAVAGCVWGGTLIWQAVANRHRIAEACGGLVPAGSVLELSPAGGDVTLRQGDEGNIDLSEGFPQMCELFSTEAAEKAGTGAESRRFFTAAVGGLEHGHGSPEKTYDSVLNDDNWYKSTTHPSQPLGKDIAGLVTDAGVTVSLPCPGGEVNGHSVEELWARAGLDTGRPFTAADGQITGHDRDVLAETAVATANNLAEKAGCEDRLPDPPEGIPALPEGDVPAARAEDTCAWYREGGFAKDPDRPDKVLESRVDDRLWDERCALVLSESRRSSAAETHRRTRELDHPFRPGDWFVSFHTYRGERARNIHLDTMGHPAPGVPAEPGKAGRAADDSLWWASSVCAGKRPQVHTMTASSSYDRVVPRRRLEALFRAYVDEVTTRRDCASVTFPAPADFATPEED